MEKRVNFNHCIFYEEPDRCNNKERKSCYCCAIWFMQCDKIKEKE